mgnify:CR=1 FL=1
MKSNFAAFAALLPLLLGAADGTVVEARLKFISTTRPLVGIGIVQNKKAEGLVIPTDMFSDEIVYRGPARLELVELKTVTVKQAPPTSDVEADKAAATCWVSGSDCTMSSPWQYRPKKEPSMAASNILGMRKPGSGLKCTPQAPSNNVRVVVSEIWR